MCIGCHGIPGYQASFPEIHKVPMIAGRTAKLHRCAALTAYQKGRGASTRLMCARSPRRCPSRTSPIWRRSRATGERAANLRLDRAEPPALSRRCSRRHRCASCHGANFSTPIDPSYPKLAGQHPDYLYVALKAYQERNSAQLGRGNAIMGGMAAPFTHKELKLLAAYFGSLPGEVKTVPESRFR